MKLFRSPHRAISLLLSLLCVLGLMGCPQTLVRRLEQLRPPPGYRPIEVVDTDGQISIDSLLAQQPLSVSSASDTISRNFPAEARSDATFDSEVQPQRQVCIVTMQPRRLDDSNYPVEIAFELAVTDSLGRLVTGLAPPFYRGAQPWRTLWYIVTDSCRGITTVVDSFTVEEVRLQRSERYAVAFILDHSPSMGRARIIRLRQAVQQTLKQFLPGDAATVIVFGGKSVVELPLTADTSAFAQFHPLSAQMIDGTAVYDAVATAVHELRKLPPQYRKVAILLSDGEDNSSKLSLPQAVRCALDSGVTIYTIAYGLSSEEDLHLLAHSTHGHMYRIYSVREFASVFARIYRALRSYYRIRYRPPECAGIHTVRVGLQVTGCSTVATGYYDRSVLTTLDSVGTMIFLPIEFDYDQATIRPESMPLLERVGEALKAHSRLHLEVRGHTDDRGSDIYNMQLSQRRAEAVVEALVQMGVERARLRAVGFGESRPLVPNTSEENRARNRRTEFVIISN